jgi:hypothetical protein
MGLAFETWFFPATKFATRRLRRVRLGPIHKQTPTNHHFFAPMVA